MRRVYKSTAAGRKALAAAKVKVSELVGELFEDGPPKRVRRNKKKG
jgi:hypothetical protein